MPVVRQRGRQRKPKNHRVKEVADRVLERTSEVAQHEFNNAFLVNPHPVTLYLPLTNGYRCTCTYNDTLASDGSMKPEVMDTLLSGSPVTMTPADSAHADRSTLTNTTNIRMRTGENKRTPDSLTADEEIVDLGEIDESMSTPSTNPFGFSGTSCPVCFGTSYIGGYNVFRGSRTVLTPSNFKDAEGVSIDHTSAPNKLMAEREGAFVLFNIMVPKNAVAVESIRIFDNQQQVFLPLSVNNVLLGGEGGCSPESILAFATGVKSLLKLEFPVRGAKITHIELQFRLSSEMLLADFSKIQDLQDIILLEGLATGTIVLPSLVAEVPKLSMLFDHVYSRYWRTTDSDPLMDARGHVYGHECNAFPLKEFELGTMLPHGGNKAMKAGNPIERI